MGRGMFETVGFVGYSERNPGAGRIGRSGTVAGK